MAFFIDEDLMNKLINLNREFCINSHFFIEGKKTVSEVAFQINKDRGPNSPPEFIRQKADFLTYPPHKTEVFRTIHGVDPSLVLFVIDIDYGLLKGEHRNRAKKKFEISHKIATVISDYKLIDLEWKISGNKGFHGFAALHDNKDIWQDLESGNYKNVYEMLKHVLISLVEELNKIQFLSKNIVFSSQMGKKDNLPVLDSSMFQRNRLIRAFCVNFGSLNSFGKYGYSVPVDIKNDNIETIYDKMFLEITPPDTFDIPDYRPPALLRHVLRGTRGRSISIIEDIPYNEDDLVNFDIKVPGAPLCVKRAVSLLEPPHLWRWYFSVWMSWKGYTKKQIHAFIKRLYKKGLWVDYDFHTTNTQLNQIVKGSEILTHYTCPDCKAVKGLGLCANFDKKGLCSLSHPLQVTIKGQKDVEDMF